jgi:hypothetical protein
MNLQSSAASPLFAAEGASAGENGTLQFLFKKRDPVPKVFC